MSLKDEGYRYLVSPDRKKADWIHPAEVSDSRFEGWSDHTDTPDKEFDEFMMRKD